MLEYVIMLTFPHLRSLVCDYNKTWIMIKWIW